MIALQPSNPVEVLYNDHHHWLTGWLRRKLGCPESAADLAQDTFIRVLSAREAQALSTRLTGRRSTDTLKSMGQELESPYLN